MPPKTVGSLYELSHDYFYAGRLRLKRQNFENNIVRHHRNICFARFAENDRASSKLNLYEFFTAGLLPVRSQTHNTLLVTTIYIFCLNIDFEIYNSSSTCQLETTAIWAINKFCALIHFYLPCKIPRGGGCNWLNKFGALVQLPLYSPCTYATDSTLWARSESLFS